MNKEPARYPFVSIFYGKGRFKAVFYCSRIFMSINDVYTCLKCSRKYNIMYVSTEFRVHKYDFNL